MGKFRATLDKIELSGTISTNGTNMEDKYEIEIEGIQLVSAIDKIKIKIYPQKLPPPYFHLKSNIEFA